MNVEAGGRRGFLAYNGGKVYVNGSMKCLSFTLIYGTEGGWWLGNVPVLWGFLSTSRNNTSPHLNLNDIGIVFICILALCRPTPGEHQISETGTYGAGYLCSYRSIYLGYLTLGTVHRDSSWSVAPCTVCKGPGSRTRYLRSVSVHTTVPYEACCGSPPVPV